MKTFVVEMISSRIGIVLAAINVTFFTVSDHHGPLRNLAQRLNEPAIALAGAALDILMALNVGIGPAGYNVAVAIFFTSASFIYWPLIAVATRRALRND